MRVLDTKGRRGKKMTNSLKGTEICFVSNSTSGYLPRRTQAGLWIDTWTPLVTSVLFTIARRWKQPTHAYHHTGSQTDCGILFSFKKEGHSGSLNNTDGPWRRDAKWNKPDTKDTYCMAPCSSDTNVIWRKLIETQSRSKTRGECALWGQNLSWKAYAVSEFYACTKWHWTAHFKTLQKTSRFYVVCIFYYHKKTCLMLIATPGAWDKSFLENT